MQQEWTYAALANKAQSQFEPKMAKQLGVAECKDTKQANQKIVNCVDLMHKTTCRNKYAAINAIIIKTVTWDVQLRD